MATSGWFPGMASGILALLSTGCGAAAGSGTSVPGLGGTPPDLAALREAATDAYLHALVRDETSMFSDVDELERTWRRLRERAGADGAPDQALRQIDAAVVALRWALTDRDSPTAVARAANEVSGATKELIGFYRPSANVEAFKLEYLGRELALDGLQADLAAAAGHARELEATWSAVRPDVLDAGGRRQTDAFDASLGAVRQAISAEDAVRLTRLAERGVELVRQIHAVLDG
jgi:hypothetical protein